MSHKLIAFDIGKIPKNFDLDSPPLTGLDYLYRVQIESKTCPKVVVSNIDKTKYLDRRTVRVDVCNGFIAARPGFEPDSEWQDEHLETFRDYKLKIWENREQLKEKFPKRYFPPIHKKDDWCFYCLGAEKYKLVKEDESESSRDTEVELSPKRARFSNSPNEPLLSIMLHLNQRRIITLLTYHVDWLEITGFSDLQGKWVYALLVRMETPLDPDACDLLRRLARLCSKLRYELSTSDDEFLKPLNLILSIVAHYFDQKDMSDDFVGDSSK
ncbi:gem-associated protein 2 [Caerostris darwini]|uniref:Gem-associated protein 2 n=1 Tax=Caerostris darwini TaxID=1538125 RepID=A0AAV4VNX9_9ARAC|nr:gem-associated protein 2 [Caerostris darwini]